MCRGALCSAVSSRNSIPAAMLPMWQDRGQDGVWVRIKAMEPDRLNWGTGDLARLSLDFHILKTRNNDDTHLVGSPLRMK